ncbi:MAG: hypothetical protein IV100_29425, partial [Myxococcales bacterium]|nr:hypothetical protein [Myxococcales bacterium]
MRAEIKDLKTRVAELERYAFGESKERNGVASKRGDTKTTSPLKPAPKPAAAAATATKASAASPTKQAAAAAATASTAPANRDDDDNDADDDKQAAKKSSTACPAHAHCSGPLSSTAPSAMESHVRSLPHNIGTSKRQIVPLDDRQGGVLFSGKSCGCSKSKPHFFSVELVGVAPVHEIANCLKCGLQVQLSGQPLLDLRDTAVGTKIKIGQVPQPVAVETAPVALAVHGAPQASAAPLSPPLPHNAPPTNGNNLFDAPLGVDLFTAPPPESSSSPLRWGYCDECNTTDCEHHDDSGNLIRGQKRAFEGDFTLALRSALNR